MFHRGSYFHNSKYFLGLKNSFWRSELQGGRWTSPRSALKYRDECDGVLECKPAAWWPPVARNCPSAEVAELTPTRDWFVTFSAGRCSTKLAAPSLPAALGSGPHSSQVESR
jgi:hypothetical protein